MNYCADLVLSEYSIERTNVADICFVKRGAVFRDARYAVKHRWVAVRQVVYDDRLEATLDERNAGV